MPVKTDLLQGTLDVLILKIVAQGPIHGYGIAQRLLLISKEVLQVQQGSLYPALHRLRRKGLLKFEWKESGNGPMAKCYSLTATGRKALEEQMAQWRRFSGAVSLVLES
jgi:PadR family transcriptional regulator, regulatory protein PadR